MAGDELDEGVYEVSANLSLAPTSAGASGLSVKAGKTVAIHIPKGVSLTLRGAAGSGRIGGGAGMRIPSDATLILVGEGKLTAQGGKSGNAVKGGDGEDYFKDDKVTGAGGSGGDGAGGAGAGIGGSGGTGGKGGAGGDRSSGSGSTPDAEGNDGSSGDAGSDGGSMGVLYVLGGVRVSAAAGSLIAEPGIGGNEGDYFLGVIGVIKYAIAGGGGGGGGGVSEDEPMAIGGGSGGGGGGGGGGSGGLDNRVQGSTLHVAHAEGGSGGETGGTSGEGERSCSDTKTKRWGGHGGGGGTYGVPGTNGTLYVSDRADVPDGEPVGFRETHEFLKRAITLDFDGGTSLGKASDTREAYLYLTLPDVPIPDKKEHLFLGYYTGKNGTGIQYYDGTGDPQVEFWDRDEQNCTLYAHWRRVEELPPDPLVVTRLDDEEFNPDSSAITFRAAVTWAMLFPDLKGKDGTPSKITFAESLWEKSADGSVIVQLSVDNIRVGESRFTDSHPMIIQGPHHTKGTVAIDGSRMFERILDVGTGNTLVISNLTFRNARSDESGAAIKMKGGALRLGNCVFKKNAAEVSGGAVYAAECRWLKAYNCRFEGNTAAKKTQGGGAIRGGEKLTVVNCSFWENEAGYGGAVYAAKTTVMVNSSVFKNSGWLTGGGLYSGGADDQVSVINCMFQGNIANCQEQSGTSYDGGGGLYAVGGGGVKVLLVNDFFVGNRMTSLLYPDVEFGANLTLDVKTSMFGKADSRIKANTGYNVQLGKEEMKFFEVGERQLNYRQTVKDGITHDYLQTMDPSGDIGYSVYHDADWDNVALAPKKDAGKAAVLGYAEKATELLLEDISPRDLTAYGSQSQGGSFWYIHDHPEHGTVVTKIEDESDYYDGALTLREIIEGIATEENSWATNRLDGVYTITFDRKLKGQTLKMQGAQFDIYGLTNDVNIVVDGEDLGITIDGDSGYYDGLLPRLYRGFRVQPGSTLTLRNLKFVNCTGTPLGVPPMPGYDGGALLNLGKATVENCTFEKCVGGPTLDSQIGFGGAICNGGAGTNGCLLTVKDSTFTECRAVQGGAIYCYGGNTTEVTRCTFTNNRAREDGASVYVPLGGAICLAASADLTYGGCTFTGNTVLLDGQELPSDVQAKNASYYTIRYSGGAWSIALNALALPEAGGMTLDTTSGATMPDGVTPAVMMQPTGLRPNLLYALGYTYDLGVSFKADEGTWVKADASGNLPEPLRAPAEKNCGFYKVFVRE